MCLNSKWTDCLVITYTPFKKLIYYITTEYYISNIILLQIFCIILSFFFFLLILETHYTTKAKTATKNVPHFEPLLFNVHCAHCTLWHVVAPLQQLLRCIMDQIRCVGLLECICASGVPIESTYISMRTCWVKLSDHWSHTHYLTHHSIGTNSLCKCSCSLA